MSKHIPTDPWNIPETLNHLFMFRKSFHICILGYLAYYMLQRSVGRNCFREWRQMILQIPAEVWFLGLVCRVLIPLHLVFRSLGFGLKFYKFPLPCLRFFTIWYVFVLYIPEAGSLGLGFHICFILPLKVALCLTPELQSWGSLLKQIASVCWWSLESDRVCYICPFYYLFLFVLVQTLFLSLSFHPEKSIEWKGHWDWKSIYFCGLMIWTKHVHAC